jgi:diguanylate cyclase (GGDEF)-like protein/PAS domain S-box-containing protein
MERYRKLFDEATDAIALADAETGEILDINRTMAQLSGWDRFELIGKHQKVLHPAGWSLSGFERHGSFSDDELIETQLVTRDGTVREVEIKVSFLELNGQKAWVGFFRDITERKRYELDLFKSNALLERIFANIRMSIAYLDADFNFIRVNQTYANADGHDPDYFVGKNHFELYPNEENEQIFREVVASGRPYVAYARPFVYEHNRERGVTYWDWNVQPVKDWQGRVTGLVLSLLNRTDEKRSEERLRLFARALEASVNSIAIVDASQPSLPLIYVNPAFTDITGYSAEEALGRNPSFLQGDDRAQPELEDIRRAIREKRDGQAVLRNYRKDGSLLWNELSVSPVWDEAGTVTHFIGVARDITRHKGYEAELERLSNFDTLTSLPNRSLLRDRLAQAIVHARRDAGIMAVAVIDLDRFKAINDSLGHHVGDLMLQEVARRLSGCAREGDTVARQDGDEFVIVMAELAKEEDALVVAEKLQAVFASPIRCDTHELFITASLGIAMYPRDGTDAESILKHGDLALHRAKEKGHNGYQFYSPEMNRRVSESLSIGNSLHRALEREEFILHYQPQVDLRSGQVVGVEALLRWQSPDAGGLVSPAQFIPVAEESGLIVPIGQWVLRQSCLAARVWHDWGFKITVAVNLSARQFRESGLVEVVRDALDAAGLDARYLELELTESILIDQAEFVFGILQQLREMGVQLSIDDFGTGYSSLSYLKRFPITRLKIDQSFIRGVVSDPDDAAIVGAIISMAHNLKLKVIAEGVETGEQQDFLRSRQCDEVQGYYFSRPIPARGITDLLQRNAAPASRLPDRASKNPAQGGNVP